MKTVARSKYHTILVIAPCCTLATFGDFLPKAVGETEDAHAALTDRDWYLIF